MAWREKLDQWPLVRSSSLEALTLAIVVALFNVFIGGGTVSSAEQPADDAPVLAPALNEAAAPAAEPESHTASAAAPAGSDQGAQDHGNAAHGAAAHGDEHGHHFTHEGLTSAATNPADIRTDLAVWTFVVFLVVLAVLWKFAWGPIVAGLERREQRIADSISAAERQNRQAAELLKSYEMKLQNATNEVREMLDEARRDAQHTQEEIMAKAREEADAERRRALRDIDVATEQAMKRVAEQSVNLAIDLAGKIIHAQLKPEDHNRLIEEAVAKFVERKPKAS